VIRAGQASGLVVIAALAPCAPGPAPLPSAPLPAGRGILIEAEAVPLNPSDPGQDRLGDFAYAGGVRLTSGQTSRLHGLSDLKVAPDGRLWSVSDDGGDLLEARLTLDAAGRLAGVAEARLSVLDGEDGKPLQGKFESDAEGLAVMPNGDRLVSFERHHRIWLYPAAGGPPRAAPAPDEAFPENEGMEALAALPAAGPDAYVVGAEGSGHTWTCRLSGGCAPGYAVGLAPGAGLVAAAPLQNGRIAWLTRAWSPLTGVRITLTIRDARGAEVDRMVLAPPLSADNFEGLAALPAADGRVRFYLVSDDNFAPNQRTLLFAFDWTPRS
jgi:hypothetical protein